MEVKDWRPLSCENQNTTVDPQRVMALKELGIEVRFEKENINTLSGDGELLLTVLSSFAQEESKNISDNIKWAIRKKFERGELMINAERFLGYDKDAHGNLIINEEEAEIVRRIFIESLQGKGAFTIAKNLNGDRVPVVGGGEWQESAIPEYVEKRKIQRGRHSSKILPPPDHLKKSTVRNNGELDSYTSKYQKCTH